MWPGIINYIYWSQSKYTRIELVMWPGIIKYTRTRVGHVARYH